MSTMQICTTRTWTTNSLPELLNNARPWANHGRSIRKQTSWWLRDGFTVLSVTLMTPAKDPTTPNSVTLPWPYPTTPKCHTVTLGVENGADGSRTFFVFLFLFVVLFFRVWNIFGCTLGKDCVNFFLPATCELALYPEFLMPYLTGYLTLLSHI